MSKGWRFVAVGVVVLIALCICALNIAEQRINNITTAQLFTNVWNPTNNSQLIHEIVQEKIVFITEFTFPSTKTQCETSTLPIVFTREFYMGKSTKSKRSFEFLTAIQQTIRNNPCMIFTFIVDQPQLANKLTNLLVNQPLLGTVKFFWAPGGVTYDRIFRAVKLSQPKGMFVVTTGDVIVPRIVNFQSQLCPNMTATSLFVISRRDSLYNCQSYQQLNSWDVFIGEMSLITETFLRKAVFSPTSWGVENVVAYILTVGRARNAYNLCPYLDVLHLHKVRKKSDRIRINHAENALANPSGRLNAVCDIDALKKVPKIRNIDL